LDEPDLQEAKKLLVATTKARKIHTRIRLTESINISLLRLVWFEALQNETYLVKLKTGNSKTDNITLNDGLTQGLGYTISWQNANSQLGTFSGKNNGEYTFTAGINVGSLDVLYKICYDDCQDACLSDRVLHIEISKDAPVLCQVPNLLTPNNDGFNDLLVIDCIGTIRGANLYVYSQWGELVYNSTDYRNDWGGTWKNKPLPDGTYFYVFQLDSIQDAQKGFISIIR
jgi:gliding motility-associated-like protein